MPIGSIVSQPSANSLNAAYRPILFTITATATGGGIPPVVYCDVYFNDIYYKTFGKTQYKTPTTWEFDIQDAAQEYLKKYLEANGQSLVLDIADVLAKTQCKFRSSGFDVEGLIQPEDIAPVQGTLDVDPVPGTGTVSNVFYSLNVTLQHEDNQDVALHLASYRQGTWAAGTYPLTHRPARYKMCIDNSDSFPIVSDDVPSKLVLRYTLRDATQESSDSTLPCTAASFNSTPALPNATEDIAYNQTLVLLGTLPFALGNIIKPGWMTISLSGNTINFTGTPLTADIAVDVDVSFDVTNCTADVLSFATEIDVVEATPCVAVGTSGSTVLANATVAIPYSQSIAITGTGPFILTGIVKPAWMNIAVVGSNLQFTGTPGFADQGVDKVVDVTVQGCNGSSVRIYNLIQVNAAGKSMYVINDTGASLTLITDLGTYVLPMSGSIYTNDGVITIQVMTGAHNVEEIQSMPTALTTTTGAIQGDVITLDDVSITNYLWFKT
jgi:hypothetical protein